MSEDTYKGESPGKKLARLHFWRTVKRLLGAEFGQREFYFLASREGGDASVLSGLGAHESQMCAVERNQDAADVFAERFPGVRLIRGDVASVPISRRAVVFLDFCSQLSAGVITTGRAVLDRLHPGALFGVAVLRGREQSTSKIEPIVFNRKERRRLGSLTGRDVAPALRILADTNANEISSAFGGLRQVGTMFSIAGSPGARRYALNPLLDIDYHSRSRSSGGSPFSIALVGVSHRNLNSGTEHPRAAIEPATERDIRSFVLSSRYGPRTAQLLNVPASTVAAWKAHATRGTYKDHAAE